MAALRPAETPIGWMPHYDDIEWRGLEFSREAFDQLQGLRPERTWRSEVMGQEEMLIDLHDHLPPEMIYEREFADPAVVVRFYL